MGVDVTPYVVLLRGINVGGHRKVPMAELRQVCEGIGATDVSTYIQSGNVVLAWDGGTEQLLQKLAVAIETHFGFAVDLVVRTGEELAAVAGSDHYAQEADGTKRIVWFLEQVLTTEAQGRLDALDAASFAPEAWTVDGRELYVHLPNGQGRAKVLDPLARAIKPAVATARNWRTVERLSAMVAELA